MRRITVLYEKPSDPAGFDAHYPTHIQLVLALPGLRRFSWSRPDEGDDARPYLVAELDFDDADAVAAAQESPAMTEVVADAGGMGVPMILFTGDVEQAAP
ncbi:EthD family reductase [Microbacterium sp. X-17]|uniref:EthD family reductase n=1 Tax=Microbacterium sp. X-17 TaxID=3144404 RepID=UPI0031F4B995